MNRRTFLERGGAFAASLAFARSRVLHSQHQHEPRTTTARAPRATALRPDTLQKFVDPLPIPPTARPAAMRHDPHANTPAYRLAMRPVTCRVHRDLPPTQFWSFGTTFPGPTIETVRGQGIWIDWVNQLPNRHFLPIDHTIHGAEADKSEGRAVVHVHGARVAPENDGYPERWLEPGKSASYYYPNEQDAATLWYHDHTMGINRLNVYAGLMGVYLITDPADQALNLPSGRYDIPLLICDRLLHTDGQLDYPTSGDPESPWTEDGTGDAILINGKLYPYLDVEPRKYRFRIINGSNGRFLRLSADNGPRFHQIATDQGLMAAPAEIERIRLAPAERVDVVVDFAGLQRQRVVLDNDGLAILEFWVGADAVEDPSALPATLRTIDRLDESAVAQTRVHTLSQQDNSLARPIRMLLNGARWHEPVTEQPRLGSTEIWTLVNTSDDSHPIHLHLVRFQILDRRNFDLYNFETNNRLVYTGAPLRPDPSEAGWKDTVRAEAGMATRIIVKFDGFAGRYMWHCHILEHGDNEMMRPFDVIA